MGSLLPGWDSEYIPPPMAISDEMHEEKLASTKSLLLRRKSSDGNTEPQGGPLLTRKSAPSALVIQKLMSGLQEEISFQPTVEEEEEIEDEEQPKSHSLYARDKWWRKFSSANLNEMAEEEDESKDNNTYTPQFDLSGGNPYKKKET